MLPRKIYIFLILVKKRLKLLFVNKKRTIQENLKKVGTLFVCIEREFFKLKFLLENALSPSFWVVRFLFQPEFFRV